MEDRSSKNIRTLAIYARLCEGRAISKMEEAERFGVDARSIQRDIDDIRAFLDERQVEHSTDRRSIVYDRNRKGFVLTGEEGSMMSNSEILAVSKILLASRAFTKRELDSVLRKMVDGCVPLKNMELVKDLLRNEQSHYVELCHKTNVQERLWDIGMCIKEQNLVAIQYNKNKQIVRYIVEPAAVLFAEYYFYLIAFIVELNTEKQYAHKYECHATFRIDRIIEYKRLEEKFQVIYADRFQEGEFRKRIQFMYAGQLMRIRLRFYGDSPEPVLDRLPTACVVEQKEDEYIIDAEVYGNGIIMWLLSQGKRIEVISPETLRLEMKREVEKILEFYQ